MTQSQRAAVQAADNKFYDAEAAAEAGQAESARAAQDTAAAQDYANRGVLIENAQRKQAADAAFFAKQTEQLAVITRVQALWAACHQAQLDKAQAALDALQTGATEFIPPNQQGANTLAR